MRHNQFRDAIAAHFQAHPSQKISAYTLMQIGGALAFRTRVSECRRQLNMDIRNEVKRDRNGVATSWYWFIPKPTAQPEQAGLFV